LAGKVFTTEMKERNTEKDCDYCEILVKLIYTLWDTRN